MTVDEDHAFGSGVPFTLGVEEELFLVDRVTGRQTNTSRAVLARLPAVSGQVERELHACQVELITDVHRSADAIAGALQDMRGAVEATGAGLRAAGTHLSAIEGEVENNCKV